MTVGMLLGEGITKPASGVDPHIAQFGIIAAISGDNYGVDSVGSNLVYPTGSGIGGVTPGAVAVTESGFHGNGFGSITSSKYWARHDNASLSMGASARMMVSCWVRTTANAAQVLFGKYDGAANKREWLLYLLNGGAAPTLLLIGSPNGTDQTFQASPPTVSLNTWHHCVGYYDGTVLGVALDGGSFATVPYTTDINNNTTPFKIGVRDNNNTDVLAGKIDDIIICKNPVGGVSDVVAAAFRDWSYNGGVGVDVASLTTRVAQVVICKGDSRTSGYQSTGDNTYPILMAESINRPVVDLGIVNEKVSQMITDGPTEIDAVYTGNQIVVMQGGINDLGVEGVSAATCHSRIKTFCQDRRAAGKRVVVCSLLPATMSQPTSVTRPATNDLMRGDWTSYADGFVDLAADPRFGDEGDQNDTNYYQVDGIHYSNELNRILGEELIGPAVGAMA